MTVEQSYTHERRTSARRRAVEGDLPALTKTLQKHLGQALLAVVVDSSSRTITR